MGWTSLTVDVAGDDAELVESLLWDEGCSGLEVREGPGTVLPGQRAPAPGECIVVAWFEEAAAAGEALQVLQSRGLPRSSSLEAAPDTDWSLAWRERIHSTRVGRLWVGPPWETPPDGAVAIVIEPKMAFGTGDHPTTALCLAAVDDFCAAHPGASVLDVGTGTGVLALAARKLGAGRVVGVDNDAHSVELAREAAAANGVPEVVLGTDDVDSLDGRFDLVLANILANTLEALAPTLAARTGQRLVLSGVLAHQADEVAQAYSAQGLSEAGRAASGEWVRLDFVRP